MQSKTRTMDLAEEDFRKSGGADAAAEGADASSALGRMRGLGARLAHKALTSLCTALRPGGRLLLVARAAPEEALPALTSGFGEGLLSPTRRFLRPERRTNARSSFASTRALKSTAEWSMVGRALTPSAWRRVCRRAALGRRAQRCRCRALR